MLFTLLCTVAILHCLLRRQRRQNIQHDPHPIVMLYISPSEPYAHWQEKINHDNAVALISKYKYLPNKSGCPFRFSRLSPSSLEKASGSDISNRMILYLSQVSFTLNTLMQDLPLIGQSPSISHHDSPFCVQHKDTK